MKIIKAIYTFIVGDMVILIGVAIMVVVLALLNILPAFAAVKAISGGVLPVAVLVILLTTLRRETGHRS
jgi:chromate transport protein ChrA